MKIIYAAVTALVLFALVVCGDPTASTLQEPDTNQVSFWCPGVGIKLEPVSTPFVVPPPPAGYTYTLLVLKAGSGFGSNETFINPVVGQSYSRTDGKEISHAILCKELPGTTTTVTMPPSSTSTTLPPTPNTFAVPGGSTTTTSTFPPDTPPLIPPTTCPLCTSTTTTLAPAVRVTPTTVPVQTSLPSGTLPKTE